jgi:hypothetical protein
MAIIGHGIPFFENDIFDLSEKEKKTLAILDKYFRSN